MTDKTDKTRYTVRKVGGYFILEYDDGRIAVSNGTTFTMRMKSFEAARRWTEKKANSSKPSLTFKKDS